MRINCTIELIPEMSAILSIAVGHLFTPITTGIIFSSSITYDLPEVQLQNLKCVWSPSVTKFIEVV